MTRRQSDDNFISAHPIVAGIGFTAVLMPGIYFATDAHATGKPTLWQIAAMVVVLGPMIGYVLKYLADRREG